MWAPSNLPARLNLPLLQSAGVKGVAEDVGDGVDGAGVAVAVGCVVGALVCGRYQHSTDPAPYGVYLPAKYAASRSHRAMQKRIIPNCLLKMPRFGFKHTFFCFPYSHRRSSTISMPEW